MHIVAVQVCITFCIFLHTCRGSSW